MKTSKEILGLPLMCIREGVECGVVTELIIDTANKSVGFLVTDTGTSYFGLQALPFPLVSGIGQSLVTTSTADSVKPLFKNEDALSLGFCSANLIGSRVISFEGNIIGEVNEFTTEEQTGRIIECQLTDGSVIDADKIINITPGYVFVGEMDVPEDLRASIEAGLSKVKEPEAKSDVKDEVASKPEPKQESAPADSKPAVESMLERLKTQTITSSDTATAAATNEGGELLERIKGQQKAKSGADEEKPAESDGLLSRLQTQYLIGRTVSKDITDADGSVLAAKGDKVTQEMVDKLRKANKHIDLTLNVE